MTETVVQPSVTGASAGGRTRVAGLWLGVAAALLGLIALLSLWARIDLVLSKGTYPLHRDEQHITRHAFEILTTGDLNPHFFRYGSLPIYLTTASMGVAAVAAKVTGSIDSLDDVTSVGYPYYSHPEISLAPRFLFALISVAGLLAIGLLAYRAYKHTALLVLAPAALVSSSIYLRSSWTYVNVDVLATVICFVALAHLVSHLDSHELLERAIVPALFCGAVTATKYNSGVLGVPFVIVILLGPSALRVKQLAWLFGLSLVAYAVFSPFSVLDWARFFSDIRYEVNHYRTGHPGRDGEPGLAQLAYYYGVMVRDYGPYLVALGAIGVVYGAVTQPRVTALILSFPIVMLLHMATNRVHFPRTVLPAFGVFAVFIGLGVVALLEWSRRAGEWVAARRAERGRALSLSPPWIPQTAMATLLLAMLIQSGVPAGVLASHTSHVDGRAELTEWLLNNAPPGCLLLMPAQVPFDPRPLASRCDFRSVDLDDDAAETMFEDEMKTTAWRETLLAFPSWSFDEDRPSDAEKARAWATVLDRFGAPKPILRVGRDRVKVSVASPLMGNPQLTLYRVTQWKDAR